MTNRTKRLEYVWVSNPRYFITICTLNRKKNLANDHVYSILSEELSNAYERHGWAIGSYVVMPDHIHFFCTDSDQGKRLSSFIKLWKEWTTKRINAEFDKDGSMWQKGFFDRLIRSQESYFEKWNYVRDNPVRKGYVANYKDWKYWGHIDYI
ncbi:MAG: transposase [Kiritimatiellae bacterium]|jgi:putative transposase|nr:transposase [Kiritimatiellia bacterium]